jgi:hypothetical protein
MPERRETTDDLERAYAQARALADDGRGPSAAVRANVLAAAREIAAEAAARVAVESPVVVPLVPVAPPVAAVGRGRSRAINLSSWRVRSGAALCAMLLVGLAGWRFEENGRFHDGVQVAMAEMHLAQAPTSQAPKELPMPALAAASIPYSPPPVVDDPNPGAALAKQDARDKDMVIIAQLDAQRERTLRAAPPAAEARAQPSQPSPAPADTPPAAPPAPVVVAANAAQGEGVPTAQDSMTVTIKAAPVQFATAPAMRPSVLQRRIVVTPPPAAAPVAKPAPAGETTVAAADQDQRVEVSGARPAFSGAGIGDAAKKSAPGVSGSLVGASARLLQAPLHAAADRGDIEALKKLLANPATLVDAPDATGRTALLHAVLAQQAGAVRLLLAAGADPAHADLAGLTPRAAAQTGASAEIATLLATPR